jgi:hypothetical protein
MPPRKTKTTTAKVTLPQASAPALGDLSALAFSEPWMSRWAEIALSTGDVAEACAIVRGSLADYASAARATPSSTTSATRSIS